ncbi:MAG: type IV pilus biogenesis protein PilM, partial [Planctomycetota bacterium]
MGKTGDDAAAPEEKGEATKPKASSARKGKAPKGVWGLDLGQCGLKAIRLEERDGQIVATHFDYIEHAKILSQPDADKDSLVREALVQFMQRNKWRGDHISVSVPGKAGLVRFVKLPPVEEKRVKDIVAFEAKQQIPFKLEEVVWDFQKIGSGMVIDGLAIDTEVGLFAMKRDVISKEMQGYRDAKLEVTTIQMGPLALANYLVHDLLRIDPPEPGAEEMGDMGGGGKCVAALDIGAEESTLVVT